MTLNCLTTLELYDQIHKQIVSLLKNVQYPTLLLPTGNTPTPLYKLLSNDKTIDWSKVTIFMLDTYYPQKQDDPASFFTYIKTNLLQNINLPQSSFHILNSETNDPENECANYEELIKKEGGIHLAVLGLGENGHIAFNEPGSDDQTTTRKVELSKHTLNVNDPTNQNNLPEYALTTGIKTILSAKKIIVIATGDKKAEAVLNCVKGKITSDFPGSYLQKHPDCVLYADKEASSLL